MRLHQIQFLAAFGMLLAFLAAKASAQINLPFGPENYSHDFQLFAPAEIDIDNEPYRDDYGYWAGYNKLAWSFSGEHVTVGNPDVVEFAETIFYQNAQDEGVAPPSYQIQNGLQNALPDAGFGFGDRYEIGYRDKGNGWMIGILDGPEQHQFKVYGMSPTLQGSSLPGTPPIDPSYVGPVAGDALYALGFGNVHINFETPAGYLYGFRDYVNYLAGATIGTQYGPLVYVGNYGGVPEPDIDSDQDVTIPFFRLTDDLDEDGIPGAIIIVTPDGLLTTLTDFDDLHRFNIAFDQVQVRSRTEMSGVEAMWTHELTNRHYMAKHQNNHVELGMGARFLRLKDEFGFLADGGILGRTFSDTRIDNNIVGPQVRASWINQRERWRLSSTASAVFGYNTQNWRQQNGIGTELVPGGLNRLLYAQPTYSQHGLTFDQFSPIGELRLEAAYYLTQAFALKVGYTGMYVGNVKRAATSVRYYLPDMGYRNSGNQELISNGVDFGIEFVY
ncbi:MAG: BBP7 family outer membrane beta-barrel protein [Pirellulales bacterium]